MGNPCFFKRFLAKAVAVWYSASFPGSVKSKKTHVQEFEVKRVVKRVTVRTSFSWFDVYGDHFLLTQRAPWFAFRVFSCEDSTTTTSPSHWLLLLPLCSWNKQDCLVTRLTFHRKNVNQITRLNFLPPNSSISSSTSSSVYSLREAVLFPFVAATLSFISLRVCKRNSFKFGYPLGNSAHHYPLGPLRTFILMLPAWTRSAIISSKSGSSFFSCSSRSSSSSSSSSSSYSSSSSSSSSSFSSSSSSSGSSSG